jgi:CTP synthase
MRLGNYKCSLVKGSRVYDIYGTDEIQERHRHRYEFNNKYLSLYEANGVKFTGVNKNENLMEIIELPSHPWFVGVQFHPEYRSTVLHPHPLFVNFIAAAMKNKESKK